MNRFIRFFKKLFVPVLSHDASQEAKKRRKIAQSISDDQIYVHTIRNALKVDDATISDKLTFAFTSLPEVTTNFPYAKDIFFDILDFLMSNKEISSEEVNMYRAQLKNVGSLEDLMMIA
ncbi:MAG: hypothetical protein JSW11_03820 [Candidatus Heimdallarchaeota archaeon]|nr:MAG: hypothetical protein JSW11_03820 [Candidatus Heimdallarchaeota archaeon]